MKFLSPNKMNVEKKKKKFWKKRPKLLKKLMDKKWKVKESEKERSAEREKECEKEKERMSEKGTNREREREIEGKSGHERSRNREYMCLHRQDIFIIDSDLVTDSSDNSATNACSRNRRNGGIKNNGRTGDAKKRRDEEGRRERSVNKQRDEEVNKNPYSNSRQEKHCKDHADLDGLRDSDSQHCRGKSKTTNVHRAFTSQPGASIPVAVHDVDDEDEDASVGTDDSSSSDGGGGGGATMVCEIKGVNDSGRNRGDTGRERGEGGSTSTSMSTSATPKSQRHAGKAQEVPCRRGGSAKERSGSGCVSSDVGGGESSGFTSRKKNVKSSTRNSNHYNTNSSISEKADRFLLHTPIQSPSHPHTVPHHNEGTNATPATDSDSFPSFSNFLKSIDLLTNGFSIVDKSKDKESDGMEGKEKKREKGGRNGTFDTNQILFPYNQQYGVYYGKKNSANLGIPSRIGELENTETEITPHSDSILPVPLPALVSSSPFSSFPAFPLSFSYIPAMLTIENADTSKKEEVLIVIEEKERGAKVKSEKKENKESKRSWPTLKLSNLSKLSDEVTGLNGSQLSPSLVGRNKNFAMYEIPDRNARTEMLLYGRSDNDETVVVVGGGRGGVKDCADKLSTQMYSHAHTHRYSSYDNPKSSSVPLTACSTADNTHSHPPTRTRAPSQSHTHSSAHSNLKSGIDLNPLGDYDSAPPHLQQSHNHIARNCRTTPVDKKTLAPTPYVKDSHDKCGRNIGLTCASKKGGGGEEGKEKEKGTEKTTVKKMVDRIEGQLRVEGEEGGEGEVGDALKRVALSGVEKGNTKVSASAAAADVSGKRRQSFTRNNGNAQAQGLQTGREERNAMKNRVEEVKGSEVGKAKEKETDKNKNIDKDKESQIVRHSTPYRAIRSLWGTTLFITTFGLAGKLPGVKNDEKKEVATKEGYEIFLKKDGGKNSKENEKEKGKEREKGRDGERERERERERRIHHANEAIKSKDSSRNRDVDRDGGTDKVREREREGKRGRHRDTLRYHPGERTSYSSSSYSSFSSTDFFSIENRHTSDGSGNGHKRSHRYDENRRSGNFDEKLGDDSVIENIPIESECVSRNDSNSGSCSDDDDDDDRGRDGDRGRGREGGCVYNDGNDGDDDDSAVGGGRAATRLMFHSPRSTPADISLSPSMYRGNKGMSQCHSRSEREMRGVEEGGRSATVWHLSPSPSHEVSMFGSCDVNLFPSPCPSFSPYHSSHLHPFLSPTICPSFSPSLPLASSRSPYFGHFLSVKKKREAGKRLRSYLAIKLRQKQKEIESNRLKEEQEDQEGLHQDKDQDQGQL